MNHLQAILLMMSCEPLARWLIEKPGYYKSIYPDEGRILEGLQQVIDAGLSDNIRLRHRAGLCDEDMLALLARINYHQLRADTLL